METITKNKIVLIYIISVKIFGLLYIHIFHYTFNTVKFSNKLYQIMSILFSLEIVFIYNKKELKTVVVNTARWTNNCQKFFYVIFLNIYLTIFAINEKNLHQIVAMKDKILITKKRFINYLLYYPMKLIWFCEKHFNLSVWLLRDLLI